MRRNTPVAAFQFTRSGSLEANPATLKSKANSALQNASAGATFVTIRDEAGLRHFYVAPDDGGQSSVAFGVAQSVAARSDAGAPPDLSRTAAVAWLEYDRNSVRGNNTQAGAELSTAVEAIASMLQPGEWVAMSTRRPSRGEIKAHKRWSDHLNIHTHHSVESGAVISSMWAGGRNKQAARGILKRVSSSLPGFDLRTKTQVLSPARYAAPFAVAGAFAAAAGVLLLERPAPAAVVAFTVAVVAALLAAGVASGRLPSVFTRVRGVLMSGLVPVSGKRLVPPGRPRNASVDRDGNTVAASDGGYPILLDAFMVGGALPVAVAAPHAGAESASSGTKNRTAPPALRERVGPLLGVNGEAPVYLSEAESWQGIFAIGEAGSGKSALLEALWGYNSYAKVVQGRQTCLIAFDTKGGAQSSKQYELWSAAAGDPISRNVSADPVTGRAPQAFRFDVTDTEQSIGIEILPTSGSAAQRAGRVTSAMKYVFGEVSIGPQSFDTLQNVLTAAFFISATPDVVSQVEAAAPSKSPFYYANILLGNRRDDLGVELAAAVTDKASRENAQPGSDLFDAAEALIPLYEPRRTPAQRANLQSAPRTKIAPLLGAETWWSRSQKMSWETVLQRKVNVVVNFGQPVVGESAHEELREQLSALMLYTLHEEIKRTCVNWAESNESVSIFADELKALAGSSPEVISWVRNDGREFGVRAVFATQYPEQLEEKVRDAVMGFGTFVSYSQQNPGMAATIVKSLTIDGSEWTTADVSGLPQYQAIVRTKFAGTSLPAFTVAVPDFRSMRESGVFAQEQGFTV